MAYVIEGLDPKPFRELLRMSDAELEARSARRVTATAKPGFPCRATLEDAEPGESLVLFNHVSNDVETPYRTAHAIYLREGAERAARYRDALPPVFSGRTLSLRAFGADGLLKQAVLASAEDADAKIRSLFGNPEVESIHAHNAAAGCFAAKIVRD